MLIASKHSVEIASAYAFQFLSSAFWILAVLYMSIDSYGQMMVSYAAITITANMVRIRSFDLFFWLHREKGESVDISFCKALSYELVSILFLLSALVPVFAFSHQVFLNFEEPYILVGLITYCASNFTGSVSAILRYENSIKTLIVGNVGGSVAWTIVSVLLFLSPDIDPSLTLFMGILAVSSRSIVLHLLHFTQSPKRYLIIPRLFKRAEIGFITKSHIANVIKNNMVSIEVLLLGSIASNQVVGIYRLIRSILSMALIGLNISYQKVLKALGDQPKRNFVRSTLIKRQESFNWTLYLVALPMGVVAIFLYSIVKGANELPTLCYSLFVIWLSQSPVILHQIFFARAVIEGDFLKITTAWVFGLVATCGAVWTTSPQDIPNFCIAVFIGGLVRFGILALNEGDDGIPFKLKLIRIALQNHARIIGAIVKGSPVILNYQMGKVGSSTVARYFREKGAVEWHIHRFYDTPISTIAPKKILFKFLDLFVLFLLRKFSDKVFIVTGVRDTLSRDISMFFQVAKAQYGVDPAKTEIGELFSIFWERFPVGEADSWFDREIKRAFGVDVFVLPFDKKNGFTELKEGNIKIFVYRLDRLSTLEPQIGRFFADEKFRLIHTNLNSQKDYSSNYSDFKLRYGPKLKERYEQYKKVQTHFY